MLKTANLSYKFDDKYIFSGLDLEFTHQNIFKLIGDNGTGKSTFLKILCGIYRNYEGEISFDEDISMGDTLNVDLFKEGDFVTVVGNSKGKGFQGVVKRHGFAGVGDATHGQHNRLRAPGSIGAASYPARVFKGMRMAGQMGNGQVTEEGLEILRVDSDRNWLLVKGAIPGSKNGFVRVFLSDKKNTANSKVTKELSDKLANEAAEAEAAVMPGIIW